LAHNFDEVYKIYLAKKKLSGSKIVFFQHGYGGYFNNNNYYNIFYEKKICDKYFAWGSNLKEKKVINVSLHYLNSHKKYSCKFKKKMGILIELYDFNEAPQRMPNGYLSSYDRKIITISMVNDLLINLQSNIKNLINFKILNQSNKRLIESSIKSNFSKAKFLNTEKRSHHLLSKFNLQIHLFLGTGFFETMYLNFPVILIFDDKLLDKLDLILLMSVNPGFGGQSFIPGTLDKLRETRAKLNAYEERTGRKIRLEVDGGVKADNIREIAAAGADTFVAGSAIFGKPDYKAIIQTMREELGKA
jgi:ribulose-phosphate 3-epimerase